MHTWTNCQNNHYQNCRICGDYKEMAPKQNPESWEREFGIMFISKEIDKNEPKVYCHPQHIKDFIYKLISQVKQEERESVLKELEQILPKEVDALGASEDMMKLDAPEKAMETLTYFQGWNAYRLRVFTFIKSLREQGKKV